MSNRRRKSGGQAIVMVTLGLFAMAGMMGLAVDLGWSYFVQKQAQASVDGAALAASHEAWVRLGGSVGSGVTCADTTGKLYCETGATPTDCAKLNGGQASNLFNGCLYAISNGFDYVNNTNMHVTVQANIGSAALPTTPTGAALGINNIAYWATFRAVETIPQLFSTMLPGHPATGTVAAIATAAVVAQTVPGSFYGLNQVGDCLSQSTNETTGPLTAASLFDCGVDIDVAGNGGNVAGCPGSAVLCGPSGIFLSSACNNGATSSFGGCKDGGNTQNFAGNDKGPGLVSSGTQIQIFGAGTVDKPSNFDPTAVNGASQATTADPFNGKTQPPIVPNTATCELSNGTLSGTAKNPLVLGPYQYYTKVQTGPGVFRYGDQISVSGVVRFDTVANGGGCPGIAGGGTPPGGSFPSYQFYGGLAITGNTSVVNFTDGQYVMAGTTTASGNVLDFSNGTISYCANPPSCSSNTETSSSPGMMMITTDAVYTGTGVTDPLSPPPAIPSSVIASSQSCAVSVLCQGSINIAGANINLTGLNANNVPSAAGDFSNFDNVLLWQDRRNSTSTSNSDATTITPVKDPTSGTVTLPPTGNHVQNGSPGFTTDDGNGSSSMTGVIHQPRGAWVNFQPGNGSGKSPLQIFTGSFITMDSGGNISGGNAAMTLQPLVRTTIVYKTALIQ